MRKIVLRIALWVLAGATATCFWVLFAMLAHPRPEWGYSAVVAITVPATLFRQNQPVTYQSLILLNATLYGLAGLAIESLLRLSRRQPIQS
jgi:hypothetical protein